MKIKPADDNDDCNNNNNFILQYNFTRVCVCIYCNIIHLFIIQL